MPDILLWPLSGARPGQGPIRRSGEFSNVRCGAFYSAIDTDFGFAAFFPGWYGDYTTTPIHILVVGDAQACLQWLPISRDDKCALIDRLPLDEIDKTMCRLSV